MRRLALAFASLLLFPAAARSEGAILLRWDACYGDAGVTNHAFACNTNSGSASLVVSAIPGTPLPQLNGFSALLVAVPPGPVVVSNWWMNQAGGCRAGSFLYSFASDASWAHCLDPWQGAALGGISYSVLSEGWGGLQMVAAIAGTSTVGAADEVFLAQVILRYPKTVGAGSCSGCSQPMCLGLSGVQLTQPSGAGDVSLIYPIDGTDSDAVTWQSGVVMTRTYSPGHGGIGINKNFACTLGTEIQRPTWGAIKRLYRP